MHIEGEILTEDHIGRRVIYIPEHAEGDWNHTDSASGLLERWSPVAAFIAFDSMRPYQPPQEAVGCDPTNIFWQ